MYTPEQFAYWTFWRRNGRTMRDYRIVEWHDPHECLPLRVLRRVWYRDDGTPYHGEDATVEWTGSDNARAIAILDQMRHALDLPVLTPEDFTEISRGRGSTDQDDVGTRP